MKHTHKNSPQGVKLFTKRTVRLEAGESQTVGLGTYTAVKSDPDFTVESAPDMGDMLGASLEMVEIPGSDRLMGLYHLHNYSDQECNVTICARTLGDSNVSS